MNQTPDLYDKMDIVLPTNAVPFQERFNDFVGGVALDCNFIVFTDINACDYYEPEPSPTPSNTPTPTPTPIPFCLDILSLTSNITPSGVDGNYNYIGNGYINFDTSTNTVTLYYGIAPDLINYSLYQSGATNYVVAAFIDNVLELGPYQYWDGENNFFGQIPSTINGGYVIPTNPSLDFTIDYPNCPTPTPTPTNTPTITPTQTLWDCFIFDLIGASPGITTFGYLDCNGVQQTQLVNFNDTVSVCAKQYSVTWNNAGSALDTGVPC
jgi:hypothetical protein